MIELLLGVIISIVLMLIGAVLIDRIDSGAKKKKDKKMREERIHILEDEEEV